MFLVQNTNSFECRTIVKHCLLNDIPLVRSDISTLARHRDFLTEGHCTPVGSVEFIRTIFRILGINEPVPFTYPSELTRFLHRNVSCITSGDLELHTDVFCKPDKTKLFSGFIYDKNKTPGAYENEQLGILKTIPETEKIWISDIVNWSSEFRYYIQNDNILGYGRYDQQETENAPIPDISIVVEMIHGFGRDHNYTLDVGVLSTGETALVECNDAWAIGLYGNALTSAQYADFLGRRWLQIISKSATIYS